MWVDYIKFAISICVISWLLAIMLNAMLLKVTRYELLSYWSFVRSRTLNNLLFVGLVKWLVTHTFFKFLNPAIKLPKQSTDLIAIRLEMTKAEVSHLISFVFVLGVAVYKTLSVSINFGLIILLFNILMNLSPSLLQQENKRRLDRLISRKITATKS